MQLIDDVLGGERTLVHGRLARPGARRARPGRSSTTSASSASSPACSRSPTGRCGSSSRRPSGCGSSDYVTEQPYLVARIEALPDVVEPSPELEALTRNVQRTFSEIIEQIPYLPEELQLAVTNIDDPSALSHLIAGALRIPTEEKQELLEEVDVTRRLRRLSEILARELEVIQLGSQIQSRGRVGDGEGPARVLPARAAEGDPARARRGGRDPGRGQRAARADRGGGAARARAQKAADRELSRLERLPPAAAEYGVIRTYLEWLVELPWSSDDRGQPRHRATRARSSTPTTTTSSRSRTGSSSTWRSARLNPESHGPILCFVGPPGVGKTSLGQLDRPRARARVRADLGRRRPRRGGDPRPPPHLRRRDAGDDHPRAARRRLPQPRVHDRRDRQDGRRLPRRPVERDARGPRPGAERLLPRPLPRPPVRPLRGAVHRHGEHASTRSRRRCSTGWR